MSNLVKFTQLKDIVNSIWTKAKEREVTAGTYAKDTRTLQLTKGGASGVAVDVVLTDVASQTDANAFTEKNSFDKLYLGKRVENVDTWSVGNGSSGGGTKKFGRRDFTSTSNGGNGYVSALLIALAGKSVGQTATVKVWEVKKGASGRGSDVPKLLSDSVQLPVQAIDDFSRQYLKNDEYVIFPINKYYKEETYFIYQVDPSSDALVVQNVPENEEYIFLQDNEDVTQEGIRDQRSKRACGIHALIGGDVSINDMFENVGSGTVKKVNNVAPDGQGNVTIGINEIDGLRADLDSRVLDSNTTNTGGSTSDNGKVVKLGADGKINNNMIPDLAITSVSSKTKQEAIDGATDRSIQVGDVVILNDQSNKVYMCKDNTGTFETDYLELHLGDGTVKSVGTDGNYVTPNSQGQVKLDIVNITNLQTELDKKVKTINSVEPTTGNIVLAVDTASSAEKISFKVGATEFGFVNYMTEPEKQEIINVLNN